MESERIGKRAGIYIHIPFCARKCAYCDFLSAPAARQEQQAYIAALKEEIGREAAGYTGYRIGSVFFGGGTPSLLPAEDISSVLSCVRACYRLDEDAEISMELNPGTATREKFAVWKDAGINRLSIGLQSADDSELKMLGRIHTYQDFLQTYQWARDAGTMDINIDLISAIPGQDTGSWMRTLEKVLALGPEHISAYSLIVEEGTRLSEEPDRFPPVPDEEEALCMYQMTEQMLSARGYHRYEISNYANQGHECRHNKIYWQRGVCHTADYIGFGLGASSTVGRMRWQDTCDMAAYLDAFSGAYAPGKDVKTAICQLTDTDCMEEFMFLGLRMTEGVSEAEFLESFGRSIEDVYGPVLRKWSAQGMLETGGGRVRLTGAGILVSNMILSEFLL